MDKELKKLALWLQNVDKYDFGYDTYTGGVLEDVIAKSQVAVCHKIADYIDEILDEKYQSHIDPLKRDNALHDKI